MQTQKGELRLEFLVSLEKVFRRELIAKPIMARFTT
jgi:hypothetical protein